jgi:hypothetical protein
MDDHVRGEWQHEKSDKHGRKYQGRGDDKQLLVRLQGMYEFFAHKFNSIHNGLKQTVGADLHRTGAHLNMSRHLSLKPYQEKGVHLRKPEYDQQPQNQPENFGTEIAFKQLLFPSVICRFPE